MTVCAHVRSIAQVAERPRGTPRGILSGLLGLPGCRWILCLVLLVSIPLPASGDPATPRDTTEVFHIAFSQSMFPDVSLNDANAALRLWVRSMVADRGYRVPTETQIQPSQAGLAAALLEERVDAAVATSAEFLALEPVIEFDPLFIGTKAGGDREQYVLLVHRDSNLMRVEDLPGHKLLLWESPRTCLAEAWLKVLFETNQIDRDREMLESAVRSPKMSAAVLPVFFRSADACVTTRSGWRAMSELNPQVGLQLRELAASPDLVVIVLFFRAAYQSSHKEMAIKAIRELQSNPSGRQILTLFHGDAMKEAPPSALDSARALWRAAGAARSRTKPPGGGDKVESVPGISRTHGTPQHVQAGSSDGGGR